MRSLEWETRLDCGDLKVANEYGYRLTELQRLS